MMDVPTEIKEDLNRTLGSNMISFRSSSGGCINHGGALQTSEGRFFLKWNDAESLPGMFAAEARGLALLAVADVLRVPRVVHIGEAERYQYLLLEFIDQRSGFDGFWERLGIGLAMLHRKHSEDFGLDHDNYIGSLPQQNHPLSSWNEFFIHHRLQPQVELARRNGHLSRSMEVSFQTLCRRLPELIPEEKPSLLHGDLWIGNVMADEHGHPAIIDPAAYYGHREADLSFTRLFGGFSEPFYRAYEAHFPLQPGHEERVDIFNLYPLLVHVNLFGGSYVAQVVSILKRFSSR